jgi:phage major head subunit gpT-like protein
MTNLAIPGLGTFADVAAVMGQIKGGRLKALGIAAPQRHPGLPDVKTFEEQGIRAMDTNNWYGLFASAKTPPAVLDALSKAEVLFNEQVDGGGRPLGIAPAILLVPTSLTAIASALIKATEIRENVSGGGKYPVFNPHQGKFRVEMSRYLNSAVIAGGSAKAWYLLAEPRDLAAIEVVFLNGQESPVIENASADFSTLGILLRGYHDWGVAKQDPRAALRVKGEA